MGREGQLVKVLDCCITWWTGVNRSIARAVPTGRSHSLLLVTGDDFEEERREDKVKGGGAEENRVSLAGQKSDARHSIFNNQVRGFSTAT